MSRKMNNENKINVSKYGVWFVSATDKDRGQKWLILISDINIAEHMCWLQQRRHLQHWWRGESPSPSPLSGTGPGGHKASFRSTKLARRARSFKEDFLEKISQMRSPPGGAGGGAGSPAFHGRPHSPRTANRNINKTQESKSPTRDIEMMMRQVQVALKHFRDVVAKDKLEMLPGNGTIVLDTVLSILSALKPLVGGDSAAVGSATHHVYQSLARLIKLCDDVLLHGRQSSALAQDNVAEVVTLLEDSVKDFVQVARDKLSQKPPAPISNTSRSACLELPAQRNSLPDIPLTPRERQTLEQKSVGTDGAPTVRSSHSTESVLRPDSPTPPPKPPLPAGSLGTPPPLPPKKRSQRAHQLIGECCTSDSSLLGCSFDRSRSPEDSSSLLSASAGSLDSVLNHSREEDEIRALMGHGHADDGQRENDISDIMGHGANGICSYEDTFHGALHAQPQPPPPLDMNRLSNTDSGFASIHSHSHRNSLQSYSTSKRSSKHTESLVECYKSSTSTSTSTALYSQHSSLSNSQMSDLSAAQPDDERAPDIPQKTRSRRGRDRQASPYDNVPIDSMAGELIPCLLHQSQNNTDLEDTKPPPLPAKKRHMFQSVAYSVMAYMEMFGNCSHSNDNEFMRHSMHMVQTQWQNHQQQSLDSGLTSTQSCSFVHTSSSHITHQTLTPPASVSLDIKLNQTSPAKSPNSASPNSLTSLPPALPPKRSRNNSSKSSSKSNSSPTPRENSPNTTQSEEIKEKRDSSPLSSSTPTPGKANDNKNVEEEKQVENDVDLMDEIEVNKYIVMKKQEEDGPEIRGGYIDALIVQATKTNKKDFSYQEAFLTTYRTFIPPFDLVKKLIRRHQYFICQPDRKPRAREAFSLLVRVVKDLTVSDLEDVFVQTVMDFIYQLVCSGNLVVAKLLRVTLIEKYNAKVLQSKMLNTQNSLSLVAASATLLEFKSEQIAEQMTLLDAELFMKIEIPEVLIWAQEQNEERSPNLTRFTEHFNKMSYWARTKILQSEAKDREKYVMKFIKIMKHLRKINNFNSYLALLSALDSAPIRRLEWQKHITEGLKEYCALIDSSSSFRAYRQALAETSPPCIPYIGLVLQDLTFVHIGNSNLLQDGTINFSKRWQQFNIVENMKRFKKCTYTFKKNERIISFFRNFDDFIGEDAMWQISESIKPRGGKKTT